MPGRHAWRRKKPLVPSREESKAMWDQRAEIRGQLGRLVVEELLAHRAPRSEPSTFRRGRTSSAPGSLTTSWASTTPTTTARCGLFHSLAWNPLEQPDRKSSLFSGVFSI